MAAPATYFCLRSWFWCHFYNYVRCIGIKYVSAIMLWDAQQMITYFSSLGHYNCIRQVF